MNLFQAGKFKSHSGFVLPFKINCDALSDESLKTLASIGMTLGLPPFHVVVAVPRGGLRFAKYLAPYCLPDAPNVLIADDVLTTGGSMEDERSMYIEAYKTDQSRIYGLVIFARGPVPEWITPIFRLEQGKGERG